jgi:hypothetical protein
LWKLQLPDRLSGECDRDSYYSKENKKWWENVTAAFQKVTKKPYKNYKTRIKPEIETREACKSSVIIADVEGTSEYEHRLDEWIEYIRELEAQQTPQNDHTRIRTLQERELTRCVQEESVQTFGARRRRRQELEDTFRPGSQS